MVHLLEAPLKETASPSSGSYHLFLTSSWSRWSWTSSPFMLEGWLALSAVSNHSCYKWMSSEVLSHLEDCFLSLLPDIPGSFNPSVPCCIMTPERYVDNGTGIIIVASRNLTDIYSLCFYQVWVSLFTTTRCTGTVPWWSLRAKLIHT